MGSKSTVHSLVIDDLLLFRTRLRAPPTEPDASLSPADALLALPPPVLAVVERFERAGDYSVLFSPSLRQLM